jgi:transcription antitermination factor NusG
MQLTEAGARWYALTVKPRHERTAAQNLRQKGLEDFSPVYRTRRRWSDRLKDLELHLFPGYVFCRFTYGERMQVLNTPSVTSIVGFGRMPTPVDEAEIEAVRRILASGYPALPWPYLKTGQQVRIEDGCLAGLTGTVVREKDTSRVVVNVELLQRSVAVEIDREFLGAVRELCRH